MATGMPQLKQSVKASSTTSGAWLLLIQNSPPPGDREWGRNTIYRSYGSLLHNHSEAPVVGFSMQFAVTVVNSQKDHLSSTM